MLTSLKNQFAQILYWLKGLFRPSAVFEKPDLLADSILRIRLFVKQWPDQKLHDVYAFCSDGRMNYYDTCTCLLAVFGAEALHDACDQDHYNPIARIRAMQEVEDAYCRLGVVGTPPDASAEEVQQIRDAHLLDILGVEMARRALAPVLWQDERKSVNVL
jgi:hypothetical protein